MPKKKILLPMPPALEVMGELMKPAKKKTGPVPREIDAEMVRTLAKIHCTNREIAAVLRCSCNLIESRFQQELTEGREEGKKTLRDLQWQAAIKGNVSMLIWLGKQILGQREHHPDEATQIHYNVFCNEIPTKKVNDDITLN